MIEYLTLKEIADELRVHYNTVYRWVATGELKSIRAGDSYRVNREDLTAFVTGGKNREQ